MMNMKKILSILLLTITSHAFSTEDANWAHWEVSSAKVYYLRVKLTSSSLPPETLITSNDFEWSKALQNQRENITRSGALIPLSNSIWADLVIYRMPLTAQLTVTLEDLDGNIQTMFKSSKRELSYIPIEQNPYSCEDPTLGRHDNFSCAQYVTGHVDRVSIMVGME